MRNIISIMCVFSVLILVQFIFGVELALNYLPIYITAAFSVIAGLIIASIKISSNNFEINFSKQKTIFVLTSLLCIVLINIYNSGMVNSQARFESIKTTEIELKDMSFNSHRTVTLAMAERTANKVLGEEFNGVQISSQYQLNLKQSSIQKVNGELIWVLPLDYSGFTKWIKQDFVPGYVTVSATNPNSQAKLVLNKKIIVSENGYLLSNINRLAYIHSGLKLIETHFEINDLGEPYFISLILEPSIVFSGYKTKSVIVTNAQTKEMDFINAEDIKTKYPWIDNIVSEEKTLELIEWNGLYSLGYLNTLFGAENVLEPTKINSYTTDLFIVEMNNQTYYFTGMTSTNSKDHSLVKGILVNTITNEALEFSLNGVMSSLGALGVIDSSLGADSLKWDPVMALPVIINGEFYWGSSIVSNQNIFQKFGLVNGLDQSKIVVLNDIDKTINFFKNNKLDKGHLVPDSNETITINKSKYLELLKAIEKVNELKNNLQ